MCISNIFCRLNPNQDWLQSSVWVYDKEENDENITQDESGNKKEVTTTDKAIPIEKMAYSISAINNIATT